MIINPEHFFQMKRNLLDDYLFDLHTILNQSENYDGNYFSIVDVVENLKSGYFDIEINDYGLEIFGILLDQDKTKVIKILEEILDCIPCSSRG